MFCARLFICASWSPAGKGLTSWLSFVVSSVSLSLSHWYPWSGVVLDCIDSWSLQPYLLWYLVKGTSWHVRPFNTQISVCICTVWSEYLMHTLRVVKGLEFLYYWKRRLIWIFAERTCQLVPYAGNWLLYLNHRPRLEVIKVEFILKLKIKWNDGLLADTCPLAANHCPLFWVWDFTQVL